MSPDERGPSTAHDQTDDAPADGLTGVLGDETFWWHVGLAAGAGVLATIAALTSPILGSTPPIVPPYLPIDLRLVGLPFFFALTQALAPRMGWPGRATATLGLAVFAGITAHVHTSAALSYAGVAWASPGTHVDLVGIAATIGSILLALVIALETGQARLTRSLDRRGLPADEVETARAHGDRLKRTALTTAGFAIAVLALTVRIAGTFLGGNSLPMADIVALAVVLGLGAVLVGVQGRQDLPG